jgi:hypothetical protein
MDLLRDLQSEIEQRGLTGAGKAVLRQNPILEISDHKSLLQLVGEFVTENVNPIRQYNLRALYKAHPAQAPSSYDNISAIAVPIKQRRARTDDAIRRLPGFE